MLRGAGLSAALTSFQPAEEPLRVSEDCGGSTCRGGRAGSVRFHCVEGSRLGRSQGEGEAGGEQPPRPWEANAWEAVAGGSPWKSLGIPGLRCGGGTNPTCCFQPARSAVPASQPASRRGDSRSRARAPGGNTEPPAPQLAEIPCISHHQEIPFDEMLLQPLQCVRQRCLALAHFRLSLARLPSPSNLAKEMANAIGEQGGLQEPAGGGGKEGAKRVRLPQHWVQRTPLFSAQTCACLLQSKLHYFPWGLGRGKCAYGTIALASQMSQNRKGKSGDARCRERLLPFSIARKGVRTGERRIRWF